MTSTSKFIVVTNDTNDSITSIDIGPPHGVKGLHCECETLEEAKNNIKESNGMQIFERDESNKYNLVKAD